MESQYRVSVSFDENLKYYTIDDVVYVYYNIDDNGRLLVGDNITFYGEVVGLYSSTSVEDLNITIPSVKAIYVTLNK